MDGYIDFTGQTCEGRIPVGATAELCGMPAEAVIDHLKDRCVRLMCGNCARSYVRNQGGKVIAATADLSARLLPKRVSPLRVVRSQCSRATVPAFFASGSFGTRWKARPAGTRLQAPRARRY